MQVVLTASPRGRPLIALTVDWESAEPHCATISVLAGRGGGFEMSSVGCGGSFSFIPSTLAAEAAKMHLTLLFHVRGFLLAKPYRQFRPTAKEEPRFPTRSYCCLLCVSLCMRLTLLLRSSPRLQHTPLTYSRSPWLC